jgi:hypothetical protein
MREFQQGNSSFKFLFVTDVSENGYFLEMYNVLEGAEVLVMTAFRPFGSQNVQISMQAERLDFEAARVFLDTVKIELIDLIEPPDVESGG